MRLALRIVGVVAVVVALALAVVGWRGSYRVVPVSAKDGSTSSQDAALRRLCRSGKPRSDRTLLQPCVRVRGELLHIWRRYDSSKRLRDLHLLILAHYRLYVVKVHPPFRTRFALGRELTAVGALVVPHPSYLGIHEVDSFWLSPPGSASRSGEATSRRP
jgi:hypothetical protein